MHLEWQQLATHALGFLITLWILKRFAWGPLLAIMEERRSSIANEFKRIDDEKAKAARLAADYEQKLKEIDAERRAKLVEAVNEGKKIAEDLKTTARAEAQEITSKTKSELENEVKKARVHLKNEMIAITMIATEKIIREKLDDQKHRQLIGAIIDGAEKA
ncbi:MAG: F0F1 ATP synthase subunit B [Candidatus Zixiibacteriota bacterium]